MIAALLLTMASTTPAVSDAPPDIVVRAVRGRCEIAYAGSTLDGRGLQHLADGWPAGRPLRVLEPRGADRKCLIHISLDLARRGFNSLQFVDPPSPPE